jgi:glycosyltransferase involved in cell wall biosynthesis
MKKLAILSTHPIQYNAPLFRMLHEDDGIELQVFFSRPWDQVKYDPDFQREVIWDIPVSEGYSYVSYDATYLVGRNEMKESIRDFGPDALLVYGWNFPGHLAMMRAFHGSVPIWFRGDSHLLTPRPLLKSLSRRAWLHYVYRHVNLAFPVGSANEEYYLWSGMTPEQLQIAPHAVDLTFWQKNQLDRQIQATKWRQQLGIPAQAKCVGFAGKLEPLKQVDLIIRSTMNSGEEHHAIIAGTGPLKSVLEQEFSGHSRVHFVGFVNQSRMPIFYRMLDTLALASHSETWGLCVNEAMACGTPCVVSNRAGCAQDIFLQNSFGESVPWNDEVKWTIALRKTLAKDKGQLDWSSYNKRFRVEAFKEAIMQQILRLDS